MRTVINNDRMDEGRALCAEYTTTIGYSPRDEPTSETGDGNVQQ